MAEKEQEKGFIDVGNLNMYYEIHGKGRPLVMIHGGGSTIETTFGRIIPALSEHFQLILMELQAHGHTADREQATSFAQDALDIVQLLAHLNIQKAHFLGFSNGGHTAIEIALNQPTIVNRLILASTFYKREAAPAAFWDGFESATLDSLPPVLKEGFLAANNDEHALSRMFAQDVQKMKAFKGWTAEQIQSLSMPTLVINGNKDVGSLEHAVEMCQMIPNAELAVFPGGHGTYLGTVESLENGVWPAFNATELVLSFLSK
ncbi:alpha/beta hydrolase [Marinilongibacter aquaticus]|uniref:alpha/beta fold hydrolase n=1 Tax=Marinilongibacter aquaticus TaxID=2975157 RepID=UPI0021BD792C|nr:alpha/beta hydrolase [Marinilongibacter aquaticus]UBM58294.1 alpha/beta hydrolase [Marinilongibacter aquaticus]